ncbi:hypothetical protein ACIBEA_23080 [Streptomyces sp. NPDC051555]|uniref:hypothetical protein n=1 Tax=Streptomyces sp. NPDC051555 TaxID=3365657 RepID=UPI0037979D65
MMTTPSPLASAPPAGAPRWRALLSWVCCVAAVLLAVTVCHQPTRATPYEASAAPAPSGVAVGVVSGLVSSVVGGADHAPSGGAEGCVHHRPGDACLTVLDHLPQSVLPLPDPLVLPAAGHRATPVSPRAGPVTDTPAHRAPDLHALQVLRT